MERQREVGEEKEIIYNFAFTNRSYIKKDKKEVFKMKTGNKKLLRLSVWILLAQLTAVNVSAQGKPETEREFPVISPYPGAKRTYYDQKAFDEYYILTSSKDTVAADLKACKKIKLEGKVTKAKYLFPKNRSAFEVFKNYQSALKQAGLQILVDLRTKAVRNFVEKEEGFGAGYPGLTTYTSENPKDHFYLSAKTPDGNTYVSVYVSEGYSGRPGVIATGVVELTSVETGLVTAKVIKDRIEKAGHIALYGIYFDFDKADIKPESESSIEQIAAFLKGNPSMKVYVVGHTDNAGKLDYNMELSEKRAEAVIKELVEKYGIREDRLKAFGVGPLAPVASNKTEEGRAKNRRVELVEQ